MDEPEKQEPAHPAKLVVAAIVTTLIIFNNVVNLVALRSMKDVSARMKVLLLSLSTSDFTLGILVCLPGFVSGTLGYWPFGVALCQVTGAMNGVAISVSLWCLMAISIERCIAAHNKINPRHRFNRSRSVLVAVFFIWVFNISFFVFPIFLEENFRYYYYDHDVISCSFRWKSSVYFLTAKFLYPVLSGNVIVIMNVMVHLRLKKVKRANNISNSKSTSYSHRGQSSSYALRMTFQRSRTMTDLQSFHFGKRDKLFKSSKNGFPRWQFVDEKSQEFRSLQNQSQTDMKSSRCESETFIASDNNKRRDHSFDHVKHIRDRLTSTSDSALNTDNIISNDSVSIINNISSPFVAYSRHSSDGHSSGMFQAHMHKSDIIYDKKLSSHTDQSCFDHSDLYLSQSHTGNNNHEAPSSTTDETTSQTVEVTRLDESPYTFTRAAQIRERKARFLLICASVLFFTTTAPYSVSSLVEHFTPNFHLDPTTKFSALWILNTNSFINVYLYCAIFKEFRMHVRKMFSWVCCFKNKRKAMTSLTSKNQRGGYVTETSESTKHEEEKSKIVSEEKSATDNGFVAKPTCCNSSNSVHKISVKEFKGENSSNSRNNFQEFNGWPSGFKLEPRDDLGVNGRISLFKVNYQVPSSVSSTTIFSGSSDRSTTLQGYAVTSVDV